jgi:hypothetical protein
MLSNISMEVTASIIRITFHLVLETVKVKLQQRTMEALGGEEAKLLLILDLITGWFVVIIMPQPYFIPKEVTFISHWVVSWVALRTNLDTD